MAKGGQRLWKAACESPVQHSTALGRAEAGAALQCRQSGQAVGFSPFLPLLSLFKCVSGIYCCFLIQAAHNKHSNTLLALFLRLNESKPANKHRQDPLQRPVQNSLLQRDFCLLLKVQDGDASYGVQIVQRKNTNVFPMPDISRQMLQRPVLARIPNLHFCMGFIWALQEQHSGSRCWTSCWTLVQ